MTFESTLHDVLAERLREAYRAAIPPLRDGLDPADATGAYAIQAINTKYWRNAGRRIVGRKVGLTSEVVQAQLGVDQPDFGVLFEDMALPNRGFLDPSRVMQPKAEAEIAVVMARDFDDPDATMETVASAIDHVTAAIEIVDSRIADWKITFADTVADNGSAAFFVLSDERKPLAGLDLYSCGMVMEVNDTIRSVGAGAACLGHPLKAAAWLVRTLARNGDGLRAGDVLLTGALGPMVALTRGDRITARVGGLGQVGFSYGEART